MREYVTNGNELVARAMLDAGIELFAGYPITPSSEIMHTLSALLPANGKVCLQMEDEISSISAALGASMSGKKAATASSGPGLSLKAEQIGLGFMAEIPLVIVDVMRGGPSTGLPTRTSQADIAFLSSPTHGDFAPIILVPSTLEEVYYKTIEAFNLAELYSTPVFLVLDETLGHLYSKVSIKELEDIEIAKRPVFNGPKEEYKPYAVADDSPAILMPFFKGYKFHITGLNHGALGFPTEDAALSTSLIHRLFNKIESKKEAFKDIEVINPSAKTMIVCYGSVSLSARTALDGLKKEGIDIGLMIVKTLYPVPYDAFSNIEATRIIVAEMNMGQYIKEVSLGIGHKDTKIELLSKVSGRLLTPREIMDFVKNGGGK